MRQVSGARRLLLSLCVSWLAVGCAAGAPGTAQPGPGELVNAFFAAQSRGDPEGALNLLADDATFQTAPPDPCSASPCVGKAAIGSFLRSIQRGQPQLTPVEQSVAGDTVTTRVEVRNSGVRAAGFDRYIIVTTARVSSGHIVSFIIMRDLNDAETAAFNRLQTGR